MVMCSGGKDSVLALYHVKKRYDLNPLVFTFDHGFENEEALDNVRRAVEVLDVDWLYARVSHMREAFARLLDSGTAAPICHLCAIWYMGFVFQTARQQGISLLIAGWTKGQSDTSEPDGREFGDMSRATRQFVKEELRRLPRYRKFPTSMQEALKRSRRHRCTIVSPHWYMKWDGDQARSLLENELGWRAPRQSFPAGSTNCLLNFISTAHSLKHHGYTHYHVEMSRQIRMGELSRQEALEALRINFGREEIEGVLEKMGCRTTVDEVLGWLEPG